MAKGRTQIEKKKSAEGKKPSPAVAAGLVRRVEKQDNLMSRASTGLVRFERKKRIRRLARRLAYLAAVVLVVTSAIIGGSRLITGQNLASYVRQMDWSGNEFLGRPKADQPEETSAHRVVEGDRPT